MIHLKSITVDNWQAAIILKLAPEQTHFIEPNVYSLAQSKFDYVYIEGSILSLTLLAIYADDTMIGFAMIGWEQTQRAIGYIARFMIDLAQQGKGYGTAAFKLLLIHLLAEALPSTRCIYISYHPDNHVARQLYAHAGFVETGEFDAGEIVAAYSLPL